MKQKLIRICAAAAIVLMAAACEEKTEQPGNITFENGPIERAEANADDTCIFGEGLAFTTDGAWKALVESEDGNTGWLTLSQYSSEEGGRFLLKGILLPNNTGKDRTAKINLICGNAAAIITVTQKCVTGENSPMNLLVSVRYEENLVSGMEGEGNSELSFQYDDAARVSRIARTGSGNTEKNFIIDFDRSLKDEVKMTRTEGSTTITLIKTDEAGRAESFDREMEQILFGYDENGYLESIQKKTDLSTSYYCKMRYDEEGALVGVTWPSISGNTSRSYGADELYPGKIANRMNIDPNYLIAFPGTDDGVVSPNLPLYQAGLLGKPCAYILENVIDPEKSGNPQGEHVFKEKNKKYVVTEEYCSYDSRMRHMEYTLDKNGNILTAEAERPYTKYQITMEYTTGEEPVSPIFINKGYKVISQKETGRKEITGLDSFKWTFIYQSLSQEPDGNN